MSTPLIESWWRDLVGPLVGLAAVVLAAVAYLLGWFGETTTALIVSIAAAAVVFVVPFVVAEPLIARTPDKVSFLVVGLGSAAVFLAAVGFQIFPGAALAHLVFRGDVREEPLTLPGAGDLRVVARTDMTGLGTDRAAYRLVLTGGGGHASVEGALTRSKGKGRGGMMGGGGGGGHETVHGAMSHLLTWKGQAGAATLRLTEWSAKQAPLYVDVYRSRCPRAALWVVQAALLLLALVTRRRIGRTSGRVWLTHLAVAGLALAIQLPGELTPDEPVKPLFGTLVLALVAAGLLGEIAAWITLIGTRRRLAP